MVHFVDLIVQEGIRIKERGRPPDKGGACTRAVGQTVNRPAAGQKQKSKKVTGTGYWEW